ncbi:MOSC domain-containing protein [Chrysiogenes arsenatis]|uniref:MOSC domain-containing protein n=1 Tax=Chrysiogenes arsenatis TaxID=309797 RepID=UPI00041F3CAE|nr:MOSC domain-containing protein [Chrysiogenes arsenatis]
MTPASVVIEQLLIGHTIPFGKKGEMSAIAKQPIERTVNVTLTGLDGDQQADRRNHGGQEKALHHYPAEHYAAWRSELPEVIHNRLVVGGFGENISTQGLTESNVCVGDRFRFGTALIEVSQARQPCWKLNIRFAHPSMSKLVQETGRTGWYYRVLEEGSVAPGDTITLFERPYATWPIARLIHLLFHNTLDREGLQAMQQLAVLPESWRQLAQNRLQRGAVESWQSRLETPE